MSGNNAELARSWLIKAKNDIVSAKQILLLDNGPIDTPCFHAQQAIEKSLKALLTYHDVLFPKTHDLVSLLDLSLTYTTELRKYKEEFAKMSSYAIEIRYVADSLEPLKEEAIKALDIAEKVYSLIDKIVSK